MKKTVTQPSFKEEKVFWEKGIDYVIGIDEVGRGAFAGPIVAAAVVFSSIINPNLLSGINDSKLLKPTLRKKYTETIKQNSLFWIVEQIDTPYINKFGIGKANASVFRKVLHNLLLKIESPNYFILIDGFHRKYLPGGIDKQRGIIKGDRKSLSIASASILAKVYRDNLMKEAAREFPNYKFASNKGYGTKIHRDALKTYGLSEFHRTSFNLQKFLRA